MRDARNADRGACDPLPADAALGREAAAELDDLCDDGAGVAGHRRVGPFHHRAAASVREECPHVRPAQVDPHHVALD